MVAANTPGKMAANIMATGTTTKFTGVVPISGSTVASTLASGRTTICMAMESTHGRMEGVTRESTSRIVNMVTVCTSGLTVVSTTVSGRMAVSTAKAPTGLSQTKSLDVASGSRVSVTVGLTSRLRRD